ATTCNRARQNNSSQQWSQVKGRQSSAKHHHHHFPSSSSGCRPPLSATKQCLHPHLAPVSLASLTLPIISEMNEFTINCSPVSTLHCLRLVVGSAGRNQSTIIVHHLQRQSRHSEREREGE